MGLERSVGLSDHRGGVVGAAAISFTGLREPAAFPAAKLSPLSPRLPRPSHPGAPAAGPRSPAGKRRIVSCSLGFGMTLQSGESVLQPALLIDSAISEELPGLEETEAAVIGPRVRGGSGLVATVLAVPMAALLMG